MRIAFVTPITPGQPGNGSAHRAALWRRSLAPVGEVTTIVVPVIGDSPMLDADPDLGEMLVVPPMLLDHPEFPLLARHAPEYLGTRLVDELVEFDLIVAFKSYMAPFAFGLGSASSTPVIVDLDDDDVAFYEHRGQPVEADQHRRLLESIQRRARAVCSAQGFADTHSIPNSYPVEVPLPTAPPAENRGATVVMFGNLTYGPNLDGARWLVDEVWAAVLRQRPDAELVIAGHGSDQVRFGVGFVDDIAPLYRSAAMTVAPILSGSGTRIKILESWAQFVPVVSTPLGIEGLGATHREHALITADAHTFADHIVTLLNDDEMARSIATAAHRYVEQRFAPDVIASQIRSLVQSIMTPPVGPLPRPGLVVTESDDGMVVDDPHSNVVHHLDPIASIVYALSNGQRTTSELADELAKVLGASLERAEQLTEMALDQLDTAGLMEQQRR
ncbi:MAG: glycosyltransferase involved in cell wall biosynthesis [Ilumatobacter sp.]